MKNKFNKIMKENGFLIFLFIGVCIVAVGTISIVLNGMDKDSPNKDLVILDSPSDSVESDEGIINSSLDLDSGETTADMELSEDEMEPTARDEDMTEEEIDVADTAEEVFYEGEEEEDLDFEEIEFIDNYVEESSTSSRDMIMPVQGEVITEFANDTLVYSETLEEWRGHSGIDIKAEQGTKVIAPLDGIVKEVYEDSLWGKTIVLDHGDGLETRYCNLGTLEMVKIGIDVKQGDYISTVGKSAQIEMLMDDHLHFELIKNQKTIDPRSIIR